MIVHNFVNTCSHKEVPIAILVLCVSFLLLRPTLFGTGIVYKLRAFLIFNGVSRKISIPRFPKIVLSLLLLSILWILVIVIRNITTFQVANHILSASTSTSVPNIPAVTTNSEFQLMVRSAPSVDSEIIDRYPPETKFAVECFTNGDNISDGVSESSVWYKVYKRNMWVSSVYVSVDHIVSPC